MATSGNSWQPSHHKELPDVAIWTHIFLPSTVRCIWLSFVNIMLLHSPPLYLLLLVFVISTSSPGPSPVSQVRPSSCEGETEKIFKLWVGIRCRCWLLYHTHTHTNTIFCLSISCLLSLLNSFSLSSYRVFQDKAVSLSHLSSAMVSSFSLTSALCFCFAFTASSSFSLLSWSASRALLSTPSWIWAWILAS